MMYQAFDSRLGTIIVNTDGEHVAGVRFAGQRYFPEIPADWQMVSHPVLNQAQQQILEYLDGQRQVFDLPLAAAGTTFQQAVWQALLAIPSGAVTTYGQLARSIGRPLAVRAVGTAVGRNPICLVIPCHRVIASDGSLGGYVAGHDCKQALLSLEGA